MYVVTGNSTIFVKGKPSTISCTLKLLLPISILVTNTFLHACVHIPSHSRLILLTACYL